MGAVFADNARVCDIRAASWWDVVVAYGAEGVSARNTFFGWVRRVPPDALAETSQFICIRAVPDVLVVGVSPELVVLKAGASSGIQDQHGICLGGRRWSSAMRWWLQAGGQKGRVGGTGVGAGAVGKGLHDIRRVYLTTAVLDECQPAACRPGCHGKGQNGGLE